MLTEREIVAAMREGNPIPAPDRLPDDPVGFDILLDKITERRVPMVHTPEARIENQQQALMTPQPRRWRRLVAVVASFILIAVVVGIGAVIFRGSGSDTAPPASTTTTTTGPEATTPQTTTPVTTLPGVTTAPSTPTTLGPLPGIEPGQFVTYGEADGLPAGCAYLMAFGGGETYLLGECGLVHFDGSRFEVVAPVPSGSLEALEAGADGSAWIGLVDNAVQQWTGTELIDHGFESPALAAGADGSVWAVAWDERALIRFDGSEWVDEVDPGVVQGFAVAPDGTLWARLEHWTQYAEINLNVGRLMSSDGSAWVTHETPELVSISIAGFTPDGAIMLEGSVFNPPVEQRVILVADEDGWMQYEFDPPTLEELGIEPIVTEIDTIDQLVLSGTEMTMTGDGRLWFSSNGYGVFSFDGEGLTHYSTEDGLASNAVTFVERGPDGSLWFGSDAGVTRYLPEQ